MGCSMLLLGLSLYFLIFINSPIGFILGLVFYIAWNHHNYKNSPEGQKKELEKFFKKLGKN
ncbi:MAG: hypothetical protein ATN36_03780 [Epulopiscium sp. Nele67-Bin005]|nr:MAG: hypothetical protein ATN36_03780 [Epulopiscium sp. Nele67-Bin005]